MLPQWNKHTLKNGFLKPNLKNWNVSVPLDSAPERTVSTWKTWISPSSVPKPLRHSIKQNSHTSKLNPLTSFCSTCNADFKISRSCINCLLSSSCACLIFKKNKRDRGSNDVPWDAGTHRAFPHQSDACLPHWSNLPQPRRRQGTEMPHSTQLPGWPCLGSAAANTRLYRNNIYREAFAA